MEGNSLTGFRLSAQQTRLWLLPEGPNCRAQCTVLLNGPIDAEKVQAALNKVISRHEILRTVFHRRPGMKAPLQVVVPHAQSEWRTLTEKSGDAQQMQVLWHEEAARPFDFERGPLVRAAWVTRGADRHALILTLPAVCADRPSLLLLVHELCALLAGDGLAEAPIQYADFAEWQAQLQASQDTDTESARRFWADHTPASGAATPAPFQTHAATGFEPTTLAINIDASVFQQLESAAARQRTTVPVLLQACWQALVSRLSGQDELRIGVVFDGRGQEELQGAVGPYAQSLPMRASVADDSFADLLRQADEAVGSASRFQHYFAADNETSLPIQFEADACPSLSHLPAASCAIESAFADVAPYRLKLSCIKRGGDWSAAIRYDRSALQDADVERVSIYFMRLLGAVVKDSATRPGGVEILDEKEQHKLLVTLNQTAAAYPTDKCSHKLFEEQAERTPDRVAVAFEGQRLTYAEVNARANQLAHYLRTRGVGRNTPVGLCLDRSGDMIVALLGILKAGGAYLPLHPDLPKARLTQLTNEAGVKVVISQAKIVEQVQSGSSEWICLDRDRDPLAGQPKSNPENVNQPDDIVYVIYTSGSTGLPKGVANRHRNLVNYTTYMVRRLGLELAASSAGLHFATVSTLSADLGNTCIFPALASGGCVHVIGYETSMNSGLFSRYLANNAIDVLKITPSHLSALLTNGEPVLPAKYLILGGEASSWELIDRVRAQGRCAIVNHYGPTETTIGSLTFDVDADMACRTPAATVPIGRPIANTQIYILDSKGRPTPMGVPGELYIGGAGVAQGYLNQPTQTADRFLNDPWAGRPGARMYRTGDRARYLPDGNVEFLGRMDHQVKIRGYRVEPAEVESAMRRHSAVRQAAVVPQDDSTGGKRLVGYFTSASSEAVTPEQLRAFLADNLPDYLVPAVLMRLETIPLNANGKIDYKALPALNQSSQSAKAAVAPRNPIEETLVGIWADVLKVERVGVEDNFFELGGHSLLATQVISRVCSVFKVQVPLRVVFESPTVAGLAQAVAQAQTGGAEEGELTKMLAELEGLSEEEVERLLALSTQENS